MQRRVVVNILHVKHFLKKSLNLFIEVLHNSLVLKRSHEMFEVIQNANILSRIKLSLVGSFK